MKAGAVPGNRCSSLPCTGRCSASLFYRGSRKAWPLFWADHCPGSQRADAHASRERDRSSSWPGLTATHNAPYGTPMLHSAVLNVMVKAARRAGRSLKRDLGELEHLQVSLKGPRNFVTAADRRAEQIVYEELAKARPAYGFLGEEGGAR